MENQAPLTFESIPELLKEINPAMYNDCAVLRTGPKRFRDVSFDGVDDVLKPQVIEVIDLLFTDEPKGIFLTGGVGTGKTAIMRIIWRFVIAGLTIRLARYMDAVGNEYTPTPIKPDHPMLLLTALRSEHLFVTNWELVQALRDSVDEKGGGLSNYGKHDFLFVDDLGRAYDKSEWNIALQNEFFDRRWQECLPTFISTNKKPKELREWENWDRTVDRLVDPNWMVIVNTGEGSRRKA